jgi:hypothetical protein
VTRPTVEERAGRHACLCGERGGLAPDVAIHQPAPRVAPEQPWSAVRRCVLVPKNLRSAGPQARCVVAARLLWARFVAPKRTRRAWLGMDSGMAYALLRRHGRPLQDTISQHTPGTERSSNDAAHPPGWPTREEGNLAASHPVWVSAKGSHLEVEVTARGQGSTPCREAGHC